MALLTPPTPPLPLKVPLTSVCRTPDLWMIHHRPADWPSDSLSCWISSFYPSWGGRTSRRNYWGYLSLVDCYWPLGVWTSFVLQNLKHAVHQRWVSRRVFSLHTFLPPAVWLQLWWPSFSFQTWSQTSAALLRPPWLPARTLRISRATSGWLWRTPTCGRPSTE